jgi:hypothetical protein
MNVKPIFTHAYEVFQSFEEPLYSQAVIIDRRYGVNSELELLGKKNHLLFIFSIPSHRCAQDMTTVLLGTESIKSNELIPRHVAGERHSGFLEEPVLSIVLHASDKENAILRPETP